MKFMFGGITRKETQNKPENLKGKIIKQKKKNKIRKMKGK